jgi:hypothetical protein
MPICAVCSDIAAWNCAKSASAQSHNGERLATLQPFAGRQIPIMNRQTPHQSLERTATLRTFTFQMIKTVSVKAKPRLGGGR